MSMKMPKGKYMATVKVGEKGADCHPEEVVRGSCSALSQETRFCLWRTWNRASPSCRISAYMKFVDAVFSVQQEPPVAPDGELEAEK